MLYTVKSQSSACTEFDSLVAWWHVATFGTKLSSVEDWWQASNDVDWKKSECKRTYKEWYILVKITASDHDRKNKNYKLQIKKCFFRASACVSVDMLMLFEMAKRAST